MEIRGACFSIAYFISLSICRSSSFFYLKADCLLPARRQLILLFLFLTKLRPSTISPSRIFLSGTFQEKLLSRSWCLDESERAPMAPTTLLSNYTAILEIYTNGNFSGPDVHTIA